jgi:hypothetical protein
VQLTELMMAAAITVSVGGVAYAELNPDEISAPAREVAAQATCRTVDTAIAAYMAVYDEEPATVADLADLVEGDITAYRIADGVAAGPGC